MCVVLATRPASGLTEFRKAFEEKYAKNNPAATPEFKEALKKASCNVCHVKGEKKDVRNAYGNALAELIEGSAKERLDNAKNAGGTAARKAETEKLIKELQAALDEAEKAKVDPENAESETFGERLHANKLPVDIPAGDDKDEEEEDNG